MSGVGTEALVEESREVLRAHARSFRIAAWFLPSDVQDDAAVCYAFCRNVDDAVDGASDPLSGRAAGESLLAELRGRAMPRPIVVAWRKMALRRRVPSYTAYHLLDGALSDTEPVRIPDDASLVRYAYEVAGTVGLMMCGLLGVKDKAAHPHAVDLGIGMQLTNICRDVAEDAAMGRVYLPRTRLEAHGTSPEALLAGDAPREAVAAVVREVLGLAERYYASAERGMPAIPARSRLAIYAAMHLYRAIGRKLLRQGGDALAGRTVLRAPERAYALLSGISAFIAGLVAVHAPVLQDRELHAPLAGLPGARHLPG